MLSIVPDMRGVTPQSSDSTAAKYRAASLVETSTQSIGTSPTSRSMSADGSSSSSDMGRFPSAKAACAAAAMPTPLSPTPS